MKTFHRFLKSFQSVYIFAKIKESLLTVFFFATTLSAMAANHTSGANETLGEEQIQQQQDQKRKETLDDMQVQAQKRKKTI